MDFSTLNFGAPAAERDIATGLKDYFVESEAFKRVASGNKTIILGNRGSGKSAIFKILAEKERAKKSIVLELSPDDYSYEMLNKIMLPENRGAWAKQGAYTAAWKYLIYVLIMKKLVGDKFKFKGGVEAKIYNYLRDNHAGTQDNPISTLISYLKRLEGIKVGTYEAAIKTKELTKLYKLEEIQNHIPSIIELCSRRKVFVLVDELDRGWDASEDAKAFVAGLFHAAISLNQHTANLRVLVSLRRELYDSIPTLYEDVQKVRDILETISWDEPSLLELVGKRIRYSVPALKEEKDFITCWNHIFSETLDYRQSKSYNYFMDRTLYRPREIIQFCTDALSVARKENTWPINYTIISKAEIVYSEDRTKDIVAEYRFQYPGLSSVLEAFRGRSYNFDHDELENLCLGISMGEYRIDETANWVIDQDSDYIIDTLWKIGFLRAQAVGGVKALRRSGSSYLGPHQVSNLNLRNIQRFHVHPMFRSYLGMKESKG